MCVCVCVCVVFECVAATLQEPHFCSPASVRLPPKPMLYAKHAMCPSRPLHAKDKPARKVCHGCCLQFCLRLCHPLSFFVGYR